MQKAGGGKIETVKQKVEVKMLTYQSTRGGEKGISAAEAIVRGIAADNGLFVPEYFPRLPKAAEEYADYSYQELAAEILALYLPDFTREEIERCVRRAYGRQFDTPEIAPVVKKGGYYFLELFHGPTYAFKDMALQILPELMKTAAQKQGISKQILILTATSGDTGKAAMQGFADVAGTKIMVFYPQNGVSFIQEYQMCSQEGANVAAVGIRGNFDDAQTGVKNLFQDTDFGRLLSERGYLLSSANSINIGRLVPQIVYYIYAYAQLIRRGELAHGEKLDVVVPSGNFGNILAAYYARKMGLPLGVLLAASNENKVIADFLTSNVYDKNREMILTKSPSMDILISSNLERLLYDIAGAAETGRFMRELQAGGRYQISAGQRAAMEALYGEAAGEAESAGVIRRFYDKEGYLMDTHTAVAAAVASKTEKLKHKTLIVSTASPYKFSAAVLEALGGGSRSESFALPRELQAKTGVPIPAGIADLESMPLRFTEVVSREEMKAAVLRFLE